MARYKLTIEYNGSPYSGWQIQNGTPTVQGSIESAIKKFYNFPIEVYGAGRTDKGVHATGMVAHVDIDNGYKPYQIMDSINHFLYKKDSIAIVNIEEAPAEFHARFSAKSREYIYHILNRRAKGILKEDRVWHFQSELDVAKMQLAANLLVGIHDFQSFRSSECSASDSLRSIDYINFTKDGENIYMHIGAKSFLHKQVRNIVGTLVNVGWGKLEPSDITRILEGKSRALAGVTAPACGLYFTKANY